eukprot:scaffold212128_cov32-Tisochrysis_lutea.AAC.3
MTISIDDKDCDRAHHSAHSDRAAGIVHRISGELRNKQCGKPGQCPPGLRGDTNVRSRKSASLRFSRAFLCPWRTKPQNDSISSYQACSEGRAFSIPL